MFKKQSMKSQDQQNLQKMKKDKQTPRILATFPSGKSRSNAPISSTFSVDAPPPPPQGCLRSLCSSNSSRNHFQNKLKSHSKIPDKPSAIAPSSVPSNLSRPRSKHSKENDFPRATSRKLGNDNRSLLSRRPTSKPVPRSKLLADLSNSSSGSEQFRLNSEYLKEGHEGIGSGTHIVLPQRFEQPKNSNCEESRTPFGKDDKDVESDSGNTSAKTPPVEASVSPEIQYGAPATATAATPVCYGTSHLLSGIKDKRKCRSKGILIIGDEISSVEDGTIISNDKFTKSRPSFVPSPAGAAMIWLSSPKPDVDNVSDHSSVGASSSTLKNCSPVLSGFASDTEHSDNNNSINVNDGKSSNEKTRIVLLSPKRFPSFHVWLGGSGGEADCGSIVKEKYSLSSSSLSCGNVVQTPTSDLSSDKGVEFRWTDADTHQRKLNLEAEFPDSTSLGNKEYYNKLEERESYVSDSTLASMSFSGMRISWREGLGSQTFDTDDDELDCCRCLSDEEEEYDCHEPNICQTSSPKGGVKTVITENLKPFGSVGGGLRSPGSFKLEDDSVEKEKEARFQAEPNVSAESICLDGDRLIASGDSDWTLSYKNHLFQV